MNDYDWERLYQEGKLKLSNVSVLDMYIREQNMKVPKGMLKKGKLGLVTADIARSAIKRLTTAERTDEHEDNEAMKWCDEEEEDVALQQIGDTDSDGQCDNSSDGDDDFEEKESDSDDSSGDDIASLFHTTRFGRTATTWKKQLIIFFVTYNIAFKLR